MFLGSKLGPADNEHVLVLSQKGAAVVVLSSVCVSDIDRSGRLMLPILVIYVQSFSLGE